MPVKLCFIARLVSYQVLALSSASSSLEEDEAIEDVLKRAGKAVEKKKKAANAEKV